VSRDTDAKADVDVRFSLPSLPSIDDGKRNGPTVGLEAASMRLFIRIVLSTVVLVSISDMGTATKSDVRNVLLTVGWTVIQEL